MYVTYNYMYKHILKKWMQIHFLLKKNNNKLLEIIQNHLILFTGTSGNQNKKQKQKQTPDTLHIAIWCCLLFTSWFVNKYMYSIIPFKSIGSILSASSYWYTTRSTLLGFFYIHLINSHFLKVFLFFPHKNLVLP